MSDRVGVALIGLGMWGKRLAAAVRRSEELRLVTCFSRTETTRDEFAQAAGCEAAPSLEAAVGHPDVEGVLIVTPNHEHAQHVLACAERGKHVFVEKPIADTLADGRAIRAACQDAGVSLLVGHCFRRLGASRKVKDLLDQGALGRVVLAEANFSLPGTLTPDKWRYYRETCPGGPLMQLGIHHADTLQYWLGSVARVQGTFGHLVTPAEIDDVGSAILHFEAGPRAVVSSSYVSPKTYALRLYGSEGVLEYITDMSIWPAATEMDPATHLHLRRKDGLEVLSFESRDMLVEELDEFAQCIRGEVQPETGGDEGLAALAVIRAAIRSDAEGETISMEAMIDA